MVVSRPFLLRHRASRPVFISRKAAGAVGVFGVPGREAGLAEQGRLLVTGDAGDRDLHSLDVRT